MELPENITSHKELNREIQDIADDMWARIFALSLGVPCPNERAKALFINFVIKNYKKDTPDQSNDDYVYGLLPEFINYLVDKG